MSENMESRLIKEQKRCQSIWLNAALLLGGQWTFQKLTPVLKYSPLKIEYLCVTKWFTFTDTAPGTKPSPAQLSVYGEGKVAAPQNGPITE